jgi:hypothetical protein
MISNDDIELAKKKVKYTLSSGPHHEHPDCIKIAYQWLDAQNKRKTLNKSNYALKHMIEKWGGRYVSRSDVDVAAYLHQDIHGEYPYFNISARLVEPSTDRLKGISEAFTHPVYRENFDSSDYKIKEG